MEANKIINEMNNDLEKCIKEGTFTLEKLDDLAFNSLEKIKELLNHNIQETIKNTEEELKKKNVHNAKK